MLGFFRKKRTLEQAIQDLKPTMDTRDEEKITKLFDEIIAYMPTEADALEGELSWGILVAAEFNLKCAGKYVTWYLKTFPNSVMPVKIAYAGFLANADRFDAATQLAREYLRLIRDKGSLSERIGGFPIIRTGVGKAFRLLTAAYTTIGARSYSVRVLEYASRLPLHPDHLSGYQDELARLQEELQDPENHKINALWEVFFQTGQNANTLFALCQKQNYDFLAHRVDLIEGNFRFNAGGYRVDADEMFQLIYEMKTPDGQTAKVLQ